ncbi:hypothetical protein MUP95_04335 [bacterium]|nr:hypothetical protein [bacterium]
MAISSMQKVEIFGHRSEKRNILRTLQELGIMEVQNMNNRSDGANLQTILPETSLEIDELKERLAGVRFGIHFLAPYLPKQNFLEKMASKRLMISREEYLQISESFDYQRIVEQCKTFDVEKVELLNRLDNLKNERDSICLWLPLGIPVEQIIETKTAAIKTFVIRRNNYDKLLSSLNNTTDCFDLNRIQQGETEDAILFVYLKEEKEKVEAVLQEIEHQDVSWKEYRGTPKEIVTSFDKAIDEIENKLKWIGEETIKMVDHRPKLLLMEDYLLNTIHRLEVEKQFAKTKNAFVVQGWTKTEDFPQLQKRIEKQFNIARALPVERAEGEAPPVLLKNNKFSEPFEIVTNMYGAPAYFELDPTPALAPFFVLLLAICLTDAGYGLSMAVISFIALKKFRLGPGTRKLLSVLFYTGIVTIPVGMAVGGYFGIDFSGLSPSLQAFRNRFLVVDPLTQPLKFMMIAFGAGFTWGAIVIRW